MVLFIAAFLMGSSLPDLRRDQLVNFLDASQSSSYENVGFAYEGRVTEVGSDGVETNQEGFTGEFVQRADGARLVSVYKFFKGTQRASHDILAIVNGTSVLSVHPSNEKNANITFNKQDAIESSGTGNFQQIWLSGYAKSLALSDYVYKFGGYENVDGSECAIARFYLVYTDSKVPIEKTVCKVFWIDFSRGGHVVRYESRDPGDHIAQLTTVRLERFEPTKGRMTWIPVAGRIENRVAVSKAREVSYLNSAVSYTVYDMLTQTIQFNRKLNDGYFSVHPRAGDLVSDYLKKAQYEFGQYMTRPAPSSKGMSDADVKAELERMLNDSKIMTNELKATSADRESHWAWTVFPWAFASIALAACLILVVRHARSTR